MTEATEKSESMTKFEAEFQRAIQKGLSLVDRIEELEAELAELKDKLSNPVVLHNERELFHDDDYEQGYVRGWNNSRREAIASINKAGFVVREE